MSGSSHPAETGHSAADEDAERPLLSPTQSLEVEVSVGGGTRDAAGQDKTAAAGDGGESGLAGCPTPAAFAQVRQRHQPTTPEACTTHCLYSSSCSTHCLLHHSMPPESALMTTAQHLLPATGGG